MKRFDDTPLTNPLNWAAAALLCIIMGSTWRLDGPSDIEVIELVAEQAQTVQTDKLVLAGQP